MIPQHSDRQRCAAILGQRLHEWRRKAGHGIKRLATDLQVSPAIISAWENGLRFPCSRHLDRLAKYMHMPLNCLLCDHAAQCPLLKNSGNQVVPPVHNL